MTKITLKNSLFCLLNLIKKNKFLKKYLQD